MMSVRRGEDGSMVRGGDVCGGDQCEGFGRDTGNFGDFEGFEGGLGRSRAELKAG